MLEKHQTKRAKARITLFTVGYRGLSAEQFFELLKRHRVRALVDIRSVAYSPRPEFRNGILKKNCHEHGIKYVHLKELGVPSERRRKCNCLNELREWYTKCLPTLPWHQLGTSIIVNRTALMCCEENSQECHRSILADFLVKKFRVERKELRDETANYS